MDLALSDLAPLWLTLLLLLGGAWLAVRRHRAVTHAEPPPLPVENEYADGDDVLLDAAPLPPAAGSEERPSTLDIDVGEADLLTEVDVYLQFGHDARAADTLRRYVDQLPAAVRETSRLLELYLRLERIEDYGEMLQRLVARDALTADALAQALLDGLAVDPANLTLRVLAEEELHWDIDTVSHRLGLTAPAAPAPAATPGPSTPAAPAQPLASGGLALVQGECPLAPLNERERQAIRHLPPPKRRARILQGCGDGASAARTLEALLAGARRPLTLLMDILHLHYRQANLDAFVHRLWQSYALFGPHGQALRERLLRMGFALGPHPLLELLATAPDADALDAAGRRWGFHDALPRLDAGLPLVSVRQPDGPLCPLASDPLDEADGYLAYGQVEQALATLEDAIRHAPADVRLYPPLLDLYERLGSGERLRELMALIQRTLGRPPREIAPRLGTLRQRLQLDDALLDDTGEERDDVCHHAN